MSTPIAAAFAALLVLPLSSPALAQDTPDTGIVSPVAEAEEDCEALRESLEARRDDNVLAPRDLKELRDKGC